MDFQNRPGGKTGGGGVASWSESNRDRRERLRQLALETIDLQKDPYFMKNHLAHTQGKKHQANLARRAAKEAKDAPSLLQPEKPRVEPKKFVKIGRPGYRIDYPEISDHVLPRHRFMSAYEQKIEPPDRKWQYLLFAAEPYETIAFKVPSREVEKTDNKFWTHWNRDTKQFFLQFAFKTENKKQPTIVTRSPMITGVPPPPMLPVPPPPRPPIFNPIPPPPPMMRAVMPVPPPH
ncbi:hypothetical protein GWI33_008451 [Rhynchophorus ferrugineus]|uniref:SF3A2 domain-containing protein n=1 Tax=Rhynchophorus ferrugineus TaxID=354439 RepID=A0A834ME57_RHYFE|nr:hypothetical protein GWI33_008451 [Rhynchophorus ferrugineus]